MLVRSAFSANIKERRDCSTALFDESGRMIAQAEHIPVHLGAMPAAVAAVMEHDPAFGEVWALNDPYAGGTHLPDITLVLPHRSRLRGHAVRITPTSAGASPARCRRIRARSTRRASSSRRPGSTTSVLTDLIGQMRNPEERRGDLRAQLAAHRVAEQRLAELCARRGHDTVVAAMDELFAYSERSDARGDRCPAGRALRGARRTRGHRQRPRDPCDRDGRGRRGRDRLHRNVRCSTTAI